MNNVYVYSLYEYSDFLKRYDREVEVYLLRQAFLQVCKLTPTGYNKNGL